MDDNRRGSAQREEPQAEGMRIRRTLAWTIGILLVAIAGIVGNLNNGVYVAGPPRCTAPSPQCDYRNVILRDRSALDPGVIWFEDPIDIPLGQSYTIVATVCGKAAVSCTGPFQMDNISTVGEPSRFQDKLLAGARIQAILNGDAPGPIYAISSEVQPVIASTDMATWMWRIEPSRGGDFELILTITPLEGDTNSPLVAGIPLRIRLHVSMTWWQRVTSALGSIRNFLLSLGGLLSALGVTFAAAFIFTFRRVAEKVRKKRLPSTERESSTTENIVSGDTSEHSDNENIAADPQEHP
jgi:hypothetical protein